jgi:hypothetical protein
VVSLLARTTDRSKDERPIRDRILEAYAQVEADVTIG